MTVRVRERSISRSIPAALTRISAGWLKPIQQILPPGMPGYARFELYPYDLAKAQPPDRRGRPSRPRDHRLDRHPP